MVDPNILHDERVWWAVLLDAEVRGEQGGSDCLAAMEVANIARRKLMSFYCIDLDVVSLEAREVFERLMTEQEEKESARRQAKLDLDALVLKARSLLGLPPKDE